MDTSPSHILPLSAVLPTGLSTCPSLFILQEHTLFRLLLHFYFSAFPFHSLPNLQSGLAYMLSPSSPLPPPPQSTAMWFSSLLEEPLSRLPGYHSPESNGSTSFLVSLLPLWLFLPSLLCGLFVVSSTFKRWCSSASFLLPFMFALVGSCLVVVPFLYGDSQITAPHRDSSPEHQTQVSNHLISPPVCPTVTSSSTCTN